MFAHNFHASDGGDARTWPSVGLGSFFGRFIGRRTSRRPTAGGAERGVAADSSDEL